MNCGFGDMSKFNICSMPFKECYFQSGGQQAWNSKHLVHLMIKLDYAYNVNLHEDEIEQSSK
jgi:hypothetical protein